MSNKLFLTQYKEYISSEIQCMPQELVKLIDSYIPKEIKIPEEILDIHQYTFHYKDNIIYIIGGIKDSQILNTIYIWDIQNNTFELSTLLYAVWLHASIMIDNNIYIFGGENYQKNVVNYIQRFDLQTAKCDYYAQMIHARCSFSIEKYKDTIYCIGGDSGYRIHGILSSVEKISILDKTQKLCKTMKSKCFFHSSCIKNNNIYVFGGMDSDDENFIPGVRIYDIAKDTWYNNKKTRLSRIEHKTTQYKGTIFIYDGYGDDMNINYNVYKFEKDEITLYKKSEYAILSIIEIDNTYYNITKEDNFLVFSLFT